MTSLKVITARLVGIFVAFLAAFVALHVSVYVFPGDTGNETLPFPSAVLGALILGAMQSGLATACALPFVPFLGKLIQRDALYLKAWYLAVIVYVFGLSVLFWLNADIPVLEILIDTSFHARTLTDISITGIATCIYILLMRVSPWLDPDERELPFFVIALVPFDEHPVIYTPDLERFVKQYLRPLLGPEFVFYKKREVMRLRGPCAQVLVLWKARGGWGLHYDLFIYVLGANLDFPGPHQTAGLNVRDPRAWSIRDLAPEDLDDELARKMLDHIERKTPASLSAPFDDAAVERALRHVADKHHWSPWHFLCFWHAVRGERRPARRYLKKAGKIHRRMSASGPGHPGWDWAKKNRDRFDELEARLEWPDCIALCRAEAERDAARLKFPSIQWPEDWPTA